MPVFRMNAEWYHVEQEEILEGFDVPGLKQESLELGIQIPLQSFIPWCKNGDIILRYRLFKSLEKKSFLYKLGELGVVGIQESNKD